MATKNKILKKKQSTNSKRSQIIWLLLSLLFIWYVLIRPEYHISKLRKEGIETKGRIYRKSSVGSKGTTRCFYDFEVNGKSYEGFYDNSKLNQWDILKIIYYKNDPNLNQAKQFVLDF